MIELRSDTFTLPTPEMLRAIAAARLGDECYGEDPTVRELERVAAARLGQEAACLMPSGTMANLASLLGHGREDERRVVLLGDRSDLFVYEDGTVARQAGIVHRPLPTQPDGTLPLAAIERALDAEEVALLCLENPHNLCGGRILDGAYVRAAAALVHARGAALHLDGARVFNAAVRLGVPVAEVVGPADSVQFCLSKGLAAPMGSMVAGSAAYVRRARAARKRLGGDLHQAGIVAAPGLVALERMVDRLADDHDHARRLAEGLSQLPGLEVEPAHVQTNTVVLRVTDPRFDAETFQEALAARGVRVSDFLYGRLRAVTHHGVSAQDVERAVRAAAETLAAGPLRERGPRGRESSVDRAEELSCP